NERLGYPRRAQMAGRQRAGPSCIEFDLFLPEQVKFNARGSREISQLACKPGSVWPRSPGAWQPFIWDAARTTPHATHPDDRPETAPVLSHACHPYSVLLPAGFTKPSLSP